MKTLFCGRFRLFLDRPLVMGIVNVTPDSFSDGGRHLQHDAAVAHARQLIAEGADIIDIKDNIVYVQLGGACAGCAASNQTVKLMVEKTLKDMVDERIRVIEV